MWNLELAAWPHGTPGVRASLFTPVAETCVAETCWSAGRRGGGERDESESERSSAAGAAQKTPPVGTPPHVTAPGSVRVGAAERVEQDPRLAWAERYRATLRRYLSSQGEAELHDAYRLGRGAIAAGLGLLDLSALHHEAVAAALAHGPPEERPERTLDACLRFFAEVLSPYEMVHLGFRNAQEMLRRVNDTLEQQAKQIARALHDEAGQLLASVHLALDEVKTRLPARYAGDLEGVRALLFQIEDELRRLSHELRPPVLDDLGLVPALQQLAGNVTRRSGLEVVVESSTASGDAPESRLPPSVETALYRIAQESLTNVMRHARAARATVVVWRKAEAVGLTVEDDGIGFDPAAPARADEGAGLGLAGIRERCAALNGRLEIRSTPGAGTRLDARIPLPL